MVYTELMRVYYSISFHFQGIHIVLFYQRTEETVGSASVTLPSHLDDLKRKMVSLYSILFYSIDFNYPTSTFMLNSNQFQNIMSVNLRFFKFYLPMEYKMVCDSPRVSTAGTAKVSSQRADCHLLMVVLFLLSTHLGKRGDLS